MCLITNDYATKKKSCRSVETKGIKVTVILYSKAESNATFKCTIRVLMYLLLLFLHSSSALTPRDINATVKKIIEEANMLRELAEKQYHVKVQRVPTVIVSHASYVK